MEKHNSTFEAKNDVVAGLNALNISMPISQIIDNLVELLMDLENTIDVSNMQFIDLLKIVVWADNQKQKAFLDAVIAKNKFGEEAIGGYNSTSQELETPIATENPNDGEIVETFDDYNALFGECSDENMQF